MTAIISFGFGYNYVHDAEHQEITRLQASLENATQLANVTVREAEKRVDAAKKELINNKLEQSNKTVDSNLDIQLHVQDDKTCKPRRRK